MHALFAPQVAEDQSRIASITYGDSATVNWYLDDAIAQNADMAREETLNLPCVVEDTNTAEALSTAYDVFARVEDVDVERYNNDGVMRVVMLFTDGCSNSYDVNFPSEESALEAALIPLRALPNMLILVIAVGDDLCVDEIRNIAGCPPAWTGVDCPNAMFTDFNRMLIEVPQYIEEICYQAVPIEEPMQPIGGPFAPIGGPFTSIYQPVPPTAVLALRGQEAGGMSAGEGQGVNEGEAGVKEEGEVGGTNAGTTNGGEHRGRACVTPQYQQFTACTTPRQRQCHEDRGVALSNWQSIHFGV